MSDLLKEVGPVSGTTTDEQAAAERMVRKLVGDDCGDILALLGLVASLSKPVRHRIAPGPDRRKA
jgi:hypothetical protein